MSVWTVAHEHGTTDVKVGDRYRDQYHPDEEWEVVWLSDEIESDYGDGWCPVFRCKQVAGDVTRHSADRNADGTIDMCGDAVAEAIWQGQQAAAATKEDE